MKLQKAFDKLIEVVKETEKIKNEFKGTDKKEHAVELINKAIDIPYVPEFVEEKFVGLLIDLAVYFFNRFELWNKA